MVKSSSSRTKYVSVSFSPVLIEVPSAVYLTASPVSKPCGTLKRIRSRASSTPRPGASGSPLSAPAALNTAPSCSVSSPVAMTLYSRPVCSVPPSAVAIAGLPFGS